MPALGLQFADVQSFAGHPGLWAYVRDERPWAGSAPPAVLYRYSPDRKGEHPRAHLVELRA